VPSAGTLERAGVPPFRRAGGAADRIVTAIQRRLATATPLADRDLLSLLIRPGADGTSMPPGVDLDLVPAGDARGSGPAGAAGVEGGVG
jgi:hypothetical protein